MKISVFGIGYVGSVTAACLVQMGHNVIGVDTTREKIDLINLGKSPVVERGLDELIHSGVNNGRLRATSDSVDAVIHSEISLICVGTPLSDDGSLNLEYLMTVAGQIARALKEKSTFHVITIRSTVPPGTLKKLEAMIADISGKIPGEHFGVAVNPEFLREGSAIQDFNSPPYTLVGTYCPKAKEILRELYQTLDTDFIHVNPGPAEMIKYASNSFHALKVAFANEIGRICRAQDIDSHAVMEIFCKDSHLNISPTYLRPGFAFGGSCLPKDLSALIKMGDALDSPPPLLSHIMPSNVSHLDHAINLIKNSDCRRIGFLGLSFKAGTDDLRGSPLVAMVEMLNQAAYEIRIFDPNVMVSSLIGANKTYANKHLPSLQELIVDTADALLDFADCIVIGHSTTEFAFVADRIRPDQRIIDLVRIDPARSSGGNYFGLCW